MTPEPTHAPPGFYNAHHIENIYCSDCGVRTEHVVDGNRFTCTECEHTFQDAQ